MTTLAILKLASKFLAPKHTSEMCKNVSIIHDLVNIKTYFYATSGVIGIKITSDFKEEFPSNLTLDSINKAVKIKDKSLLKPLDYEIKFPNFERVFGLNDENKLHELNPVQFDTQYLALIFQALDTFKKDLKIKVGRISIYPHEIGKANLMTMIVNEGLSSEIKIEAVVMPLNK